VPFPFFFAPSLFLFLRGVHSALSCRIYPPISGFCLSDPPCAGQATRPSSSLRRFFPFPFLPLFSSPLDIKAFISTMQCTKTFPGQWPSPEDFFRAPSSSTGGTHSSFARHPSSFFPFDLFEFEDKVLLLSAPRIGRYFGVSPQSSRRMMSPPEELPLLWVNLFSFSRLFIGFGP